MIPATDIFYFGCVEEGGHRLWRSNEGGHPHRLYHEGLPADFPLKSGRYDWLDGWFFEDAGGGSRIKVPPADGVVVTLHKGGWTICGFNDYTVDQRRNSNSSFIVRGTLTKEEVWIAAERHFPTVWARVKGILTP